MGSHVPELRLEAHGFQAVWGAGGCPLSCFASSPWYFSKPMKQALGLRRKLILGK